MLPLRKPETLLPFAGHGVVVIVAGIAPIQRVAIDGITLTIMITVGVAGGGPELVLLKIGELVSIFIAIGISGVVVAETLLCLVPVRHAITVLVAAVAAVQRRNVLTVRHAVVIRVLHQGIGAGEEFRQVAEPVAVAVFQGIQGIDRGKWVVRFLVGIR
ncbi:hypothetical protein Maes01_00811 [Microbulbifer aestuariivivens]|uniref:Uncharacterized protein n=1 Tax=Microbulbifer aestuariivivens TaxID=1908308 RepID=A0ABP9WM22_9GAMM